MTCMLGGAASAAGSAQRAQSDNLGLGQGEAGAAKDVLLAHAVLLCTIGTDNHFHLLQRHIAALATEEAPRLLRTQITHHPSQPGLCQEALHVPIRRQCTTELVSIEQGRAQLESLHDSSLSRAGGQDSLPWRPGSRQCSA